MACKGHRYALWEVYSRYSSELRFATVDAGKNVQENDWHKKRIKIFTERALQPTMTEGWARCSQHFTKTENPLWETDKFPPDLEDNFVTFLPAKKTSE
jgi:hypothetical protein